MFFWYLPPLVPGPVDPAALRTPQAWGAVLAQSAATREFALAALLVLGSPVLWTVISRGAVARGCGVAVAGWQWEMRGFSLIIMSPDNANDS
jgi:hypothetical protein